MASTLRNFYELPSWLEDMQRVQRRWDSIAEPVAVLFMKHK